MHIHGKLLQENGRTTLLLLNDKPEAETAVSLYVRFAFVTLGREEHIFPAFIMDDWGKEIRGRKLYEWVAEFGEQFPRGEIFGFEQTGEETQCFVRALELYARLPVYVYCERRAPVMAGTLIDSVVLPQGVGTAVRSKHPWQNARVSWREA
ncbi:MAG: hypothetical protein H6662_03115 [Ardenticatenaceae bacterium]|nr:hypothetical protein [Anaerolineales bacterium]MCB8920551.1 hypothetical protein [Ardenticatenaceae bacterium]MCB9003035.1 hypothetical protein [Ardenticatenaceae bacterium]